MPRLNHDRVAELRQALETGKADRSRVSDYPRLELQSPLTLEAQRIEQNLNSDKVQLSWQPIITFCADTDVEAFQLVADWSRDNLGDELVVLASWFRFAEDGDESHYEIGLVLEG